MFGAESGRIAKITVVAAVVAGLMTSPGSTSAIHAAPPVDVDASSAADEATALDVAVTEAYDAMTARERIGQLFMVGVRSTGSTRAERAQLRRHHVGNVYLAGNTRASVRDVAAVTARAGDAATVRGIEPFVSVDQEGGLVQRLRGDGFAPIPTALEQGRNPAGELRDDARRWGRQLASAGVSVNLAPVADVVPARGARRNAPIGQYEREYGHTVARVGSRAVAFAEGMAEGGVAATLKHFPGLGRATANTDFDRDVIDPTSRRDRFVQPFRRGIDAGAAFVMVSSSRYPQIDRRHQACFSRTVMQTMLRDDLGFEGVVVSDDFEAVALSRVPRGQRATRFIAAGGSMVLVTSTRSLGAMTAAVRGRAAVDATFAGRVEDAVRQVLRTKAGSGLLQPAD